jgi:uncharacterized protein YqeY
VAAWPEVCHARVVLIDHIKKEITAAMKSGDAVARDILRLALGEVQTAEAREAGRKASDDDVAAAVRKLIKSNEETLALAGDGDPGRAATLRREIEVLAGLPLPKQLSVDDIVAELTSEHAAIKAAKNDGQATGIAMKFLKGAGKAVSGNEVGAAVKKIRS